MHLRIIHDTVYRYGQAANLIVQVLRMWPAEYAGQAVKDWRVEVNGKLLVPGCLDGFGNPVATHSVEHRIDRVRLSVRGEVHTNNLHGVVSGTHEPLPPMFFLNPTALTATSAQIEDMAARCAGDDGPDLDRMHRLCNGVRDAVDYVAKQTHADTTAAEAFAAGVGVCQDHSHVLIGAARSLGFPARYVSGYLFPIGDIAAASHAWAEIFVADLGWVGFDASNRLSPDERYVRVACGRDYHDAAPVRGVRQGGAAETLEVDVRIDEAAQASQ